MSFIDSFDPDVSNTEPPSRESFVTATGPVPEWITASDMAVAEGTLFYLVDDRGDTRHFLPTREKTFLFATKEDAIAKVREIGYTERIDLTDLAPGCSQVYVESRTLEYCVPLICVVVTALQITGKLR
jgi:hypothetical protein